MIKVCLVQVEASKGEGRGKTNQEHMTQQDHGDVAAAMAVVLLRGVGGQGVGCACWTGRDDWLRIDGVGAAWSGSLGRPWNEVSCGCAVRRSQCQPPHGLGREVEW